MYSAYFENTGPSMPFSLESSIFFSTLPSGVMKKVAQPFQLPIHTVCVASLPRKTGY